MKKRKKPKTLNDLILDFGADVYRAQKAKERALAWIRNHRRWREPPAAN